MYRLSYRDLQWDPVFLQPERYTMINGRLVPWGSRRNPDDLVRIQPERHMVSICMPAGQGKISDGGYDQMACLVTAIPVHDHVIFRGSIYVSDYPSPEDQNGQEGLGLFFRDTMTSDPVNGYPYSNMAAAGIIHGRPCMFGREGVIPDDIEHIRNFTCAEDSGDSLLYSGKKLEIVLEIHENRLTAEIAAEGSFDLRYEIAVNEDIFSSREPGVMYLGFMAARGCRADVDMDAVSIEYSDQTDISSTVPLLYASPEGNCLGQGTEEMPLDLQSAIDQCRRGQTIMVLPGRYHLMEDLIISSENRGGSCCRKKMMAENSSGKWAVLDFAGSRHGFMIEGSYWDISDLMVTGGLGYMIRGSYNRIHHCYAVSNLETGFLIRHPLNDSLKKLWPSHNEISDCVSCLNRDISQQHADGFACKIAAGSGNVFIRCTAWMNSDDGFDLFSKNRCIGSVRLEECRSWLNGYYLQDGRMVKTRGNGNGFKLGGSGLAVNHEAVHCEAIGNRNCGFTSNSNPHMILIGCNASNNKENYSFYFTGSDAQAIHITEDCTESDAPAFDPSAWIQENIMPGYAGHRSISCDKDFIGWLQSGGIRDYNDSMIRDAVNRMISRYGKEEYDRPGVLIMCSSLYGGGAERVACRLACGLARHYRVIFLYIQDKGQTYPLDPEILTFAVPRFHGTLEMIMEGRVEFTRQIKKHFGIRVSVSFMFTMNKMNVRSGEHTKVICSERNSPAKRDPEHLKEIEGLYELADHVVFQSAAVRDLFSQKVQDHSSIILNPVSVSCETMKSRHRIVNVGRLVPQKNQSMLIRAFAAFYQTHNEYTLSFYGTGELSEELQMLAKSLGLGEAVQFHGHVRNVHEAVADAEIFVLSSDYEGLSNALLECMMMGLPCISTKCEGSVDVICSGENGILTDIGSEEQMTEALTRLADDGNLRKYLGTRARKTAEQFRGDSVLRQWESLVETVLSEG